MNRFTNEEARSNLYADIQEDRKEGMSWGKLEKKHKVSTWTIAEALKAVGLSKPNKGAKKLKKPKPKKPKVDKLAAVNKALKKAGSAPKPCWFVVIGKLASQFAYQSKEHAMEACLEAQLKGKKVRLLREVPFRLTVVVDE